MGSFIFRPVANDNSIFDIAEEFITDTSRPVFLTGKAGTGKTTFLRHIKDTTKKKAVIVAPTGVAAINAGGTTIHSFFQLPFTPFVPEILKGTENSVDMSDKYSLLKNMKVESEKRSLFRELELLIIDEVSMVRCDILDAIDTILRHFRRKAFLPFGGVQVLFIGDLFQLPPVVPDDQWGILNAYYESPFFFHAHVLRNVRPIYIELKKIYRQSDRRFIDILNNIRNNEVEEEDFIQLNERYDPDFEPEPDSQDRYITLTTHNHKADLINSSALDALIAPLHSFKGEVEGDFPERNFPTDRILNLKVGAQVMFIKNDMEKVRRYYNGKIGVIRQIEEDSIVVGFPEEDREIKVEKETWKNIRYWFNPASNEIAEEILGAFTQYAIRLAWAITIHKSQGLTFERAIVDAGKAFAPGQVYVALSRCTSLEGIVLRSKIFPNSIQTDERVIQFARERDSEAQLRPILQHERQQFFLNSVLDCFDWLKAVDDIEHFQDALERRKFNGKEEAAEMVRTMIVVSKQLHHIAQKFQEQLRTLFRDVDSDEKYKYLSGRVASAVGYFTQQLDDVFISPLNMQILSLTGQKKIKGYLKHAELLLTSFIKQKVRIKDAVEMLEQLFDQKDGHKTVQFTPGIIGK